jgi:excisionase family DNA binding protein
MSEIIVTSREQIDQIISGIMNRHLELFKITVNERKPLEEEELITFNDTLRLLKISRPTLYKRMKDNTIPFSRLGKRLLFPKQSILRALTKKEVQLRN